MSTFPVRRSIHADDVHALFGHDGHVDRSLPWAGGSANPSRL